MLAESSRVEQLDWLRGMAIFLVIGRHLNQAAHPSTSALRGLLHYWYTIGWIGVDLFFVLSGFLVTSLLFRELEQTRDVALWRFLQRRALKIYPAFYAMLVVSAVAFTGFGNPPPLARLASETFFVQNYLPRLWPHTWSLAVEEHFYLLLTGVFLVLLRYRSKNLLKLYPLGFLLIAAACLAARINLTLTSVPFSPQTHIAPTHLRIDSLAFGSYLSFIKYRQNPLFSQFGRRPLQLLLGGTTLLLPTLLLPIANPWVTTLGLSLNYLGFGCLLLLLLQMPVNFNAKFRFVTRLLRFVGTNSYSIYLWHIPVLVFLVDQLVRSTFDQLSYSVIATVTIVTIGVLTARIVEQPILQLRDRYLPAFTNRGAHPVAPPEAESTVAAERLAR